MSTRTNRRGFLQTSALTGAGIMVAGRLRAQDGGSPNERVAVACIGIGGKGSGDAEDAANTADVVAICDVDENTLNNAGKKKYPKAKRYTDFRKLLEEMGDSIDAVTVSTPDHTHAPAALMAMRMGKHCFCQKPLTHTIYEARLMAQVAKEKNLATQMGNQGTASGPLRKAAAIVKSGVLGTIKDVHVWTNRPIWPQGGNRPASKPCPAHLKWDLWLGPAPERPYANGYHPFAWRGWWDFGTGALGDMACHTVNMPYMALNLRDPVAMQAECSGHNKDSYPSWSIIKFEYPALGDRAAVNMFWYDGGKRPDGAMLEGKPMSSSGILIVGEKAKFYAPGDYCDKELYMLGADIPDAKFVESPGHFEEWIRAVKGGEPAMSNFQNYSGGLTETILLGNLAVWVAASGKGERVEWDSKNMKSPNISGIEPIIKPTYRAGYTLEV